MVMYRLYKFWGRVPQSNFYFAGYIFVKGVPVQSFWGELWKYVVRRMIPGCIQQL